MMPFFKVLSEAPDMKVVSRRRSRLTVQVGFRDKVLNFSLDTGSIDTDLNPSFAKVAPDLISAGQKESRTFTGYGGSDSYDSVLLPSAMFRVGGLDVTLKPVHVGVTHGLGSFDGNLGNDLLNQAHIVTLDFRAMAMKLE